jgi:hypothetical protein
MTTTGILVAASTPAGTSKYPVDFWSGAAVAVPTEKDETCAWTNRGNNRKIAHEAKERAEELAIDPPRVDEDTARGMI